LLAIAIGICLTLVSAPAHAQDADDPPAQAGRLSALSGAVSIQQAGSDEWSQAYPNLPLGPGDRIFTDRDGRAEIQLGQNYLRVGPNSDVTFVDARPDSLTFGVAQGAVHVHTLGLWEGQSLYVQTPSGSSTVNQQADFRVDVLPEDNAAIFTTVSGDVYVSGAGGLGLNTQQGQSLELIGSNPVNPQWLQPANPDSLDRWSAARDQQIARAASYRYVNPEIPGAYELDSNGEWDPDTEYGSMWFPNVQAGWAPYHNGHWVNHEPWGWVWVEDEPWGYAPFHFGRWVSYRGRWGWIPGPRATHPVWSPALVVFAGGIQIGGGGVSAWFPLGPGEAYHPWYRASPRYVNQVNITNIQESRSVHVQNNYVNNVTVNNVTNVNNVTYINQTNGVTAMRREDMASGRPATQAAVKVDPRQMQHVQVLARPEVAPTRQATVTPPARPVPVAVQRPVLINAQGKMAPAKPNAQPVEPPVKAAPVAKPLPGRTVVAAPPGAKVPAPTARGPVQPGQPVANPAAPGAPRTQPAPATDNRPGIKPPAQTPAPQPAPVPPARPGQPEPQPPPRPTPLPDNRPGVRPPTQPAPQPAPVPENRPGVRPPNQPEPQPAPPRQEVRPGDRPLPPQQPPSRPTPPDNRPGARPPAQPEPQPAPRPAPLPDNRPAQRPPVQPAPERPRQDVRPTERPAPPPPPASRPAPVPDNRPAARPQVQPPPQPAPRQAAPPPPRQNTQQEARPAPPPQRDNRSEKDKKDEKKPPQ